MLTGDVCLKRENAMGLACAKCGREYPNLPDTIKPPIYCGDCTNRVDRVEVKKNAECVYRGKKIGYLDCRCGGSPKVYYCTQLQEPCIEHNTSKPWASVKH